MGPVTPRPSNNSDALALQNMETSNITQSNPNSVSQVIKNTNNNSAIKKVKQYPNHHEGPFIVYIRTRETDINLLNCTKYVNNLYKSMTTIRPINSKKIRIEFKERADANNIVNDVSINKIFDVYIPSKNIEVQGVIPIYGDIDFTEMCEYGFGEFKSLTLQNKKIKILEVSRNKKLDSVGNLIDLNSLRLTFEGTCLPNQVNFLNLIIPVKVYSPKLYFCSRCLQYNHSDKYCANKPRCENCDERHLTSDCTKVINNKSHQCLNCSQDHKTGDSTCIVREQIKTKAIKSTLRKRHTYAEIVEGYALLANQMAGETDLNQVEDNSIPCTSSSLTTSQPQRTNTIRPAKRKRTEIQTPKQLDKVEQNFKRPTPSNIPRSTPGFQKIHPSIKDTVMKFCKNAELPELVTNLIEAVIIPILDKIWLQLIDSFSNLLKPENNA